MDTRNPIAITGVQPASSVGIGYMREGGVSHRNSHSLDEITAEAVPSPCDAKALTDQLIPPAVRLICIPITVECAQLTMVAQ
ncbi:hypothetical protein EVAR_19431_1 [Eumeta japonica]|uniref:Uncharacterized protein n=1 Tax=Eumeta variegata TaxID=151549 RepID=A0A4C1TRM9_EUMVA|nr:hypothetical protein EVAR_19431_1 [Eumeta japonica]